MDFIFLYNVFFSIDPSYRHLAIYPQLYEFGYSIMDWQNIMTTNYINLEPIHVASYMCSSPKNIVY